MTQDTKNYIGEEIKRAVKSEQSINEARDRIVNYLDFEFARVISGIDSIGKLLDAVDLTIRSKL